MILGLGKRYPSVEDEGIIWNVMIKQIKQIFAGILMGFGKRNMGNEISKGWCRIRKPITIIITFFKFSILTTSLKDNIYWNECGVLSYILCGILKFKLHCANSTHGLCVPCTHNMIMNELLEYEKLILRNYSLFALL